MTTLNKFNNKDLLRDIRVGVLNPMVDATNNNTLDINTLRGNVAGLSKRLGFIEPEVSTNSRNLTALNQFAHAVAQQVSMTYDKSRVDPSNKLITFTAVGGTEKTLDLSPMFIDPIQTKIDVSALDNDPDTVYTVHQLNFRGNVKLSMDTAERNRADLLVPYLRGKIGTKSSNVTKIELTGNTKLCDIDRGTLTINLPEPGSGGAGGLFLEPNPPETGKNLFKADTRTDAEKLRDDYFSTNPTDLDTYKNNTLKAILVEWMDGDDVQLMFQCQHNNSWENPFDIVFSSFVIGKHGIEELRDGNRVVTLESETLIGAANVGDGVGVYYDTHGRNLQFRNLRSNSPDLEISTNTTGANEVVFHTKPFWAGYFESPEEATTSVPERDRITNKTTIITKNEHSEHAIHVWDGNSWTDRNIAEHADISENGGVNWLTLKGIAGGDNITITKIPVPGNNYYHKIDAISPVYAQISGQRSQRITTVEVANQYAEIQGSTLKLPVISAIDASAGDIGQIKNIKQGDNIQFDMDRTSGVLVIKADKTDPMQAQVGSQTTYTQISKIKDPSTFSTIEGGVLTLHRLNAVNADGSNVGHVRSVKAGANMDFALDTGGQLTISSTGGGGEVTFVQAKTGADGSTYTPVSKVNILDPFSTISDQTLTVNAIDCKDNTGTNQGFIKTLKAGSNITLSYDSSNLEKGTVTISSTGGGAGGSSIEAKVTGGNFTGQFLPITKIDLTTDSNLSKLVKNDGENTYTMSFDTRSFVASNATKDGLESAFPVSTNAYRHGFVGANSEMYFTEGTEWFLQNYKGMPEQVRSLNGRYPGLHTGAGVYDENNIESGMYYVTRVQCPLKPDEQKELGIVENLTISKTKRAQFFWGMESGNLWYRRMDPSTTTGEESEFLEWNLINGLGDDYYSILTVPSIKVDATRGEINGNKSLSWMVLQDPRCNVSVDGGSNSYKFRVNRTGVYSITMCAHVTAAADLATEAISTGATYTFTLFNADTGGMVNTPKSKTGVKVPGRSAFNKGMYPPVRMTFPDLLMKAGTWYRVTLNHSRNDGLNDAYLDSFKNYLVIQPASSGTKQGTVIAETFRTTLGGFSSKAGYEVHVEGVKANSEYVRVFGNVMNDSLVTG